MYSSLQETSVYLRWEIFRSWIQCPQRKMKRFCIEAKKLYMPLRIWHWQEFGSEIDAKFNWIANKLYTVHCSIQLVRNKLKLTWLVRCCEIFCEIFFHFFHVSFFYMIFAISLSLSQYVNDLFFNYVINTIDLYDLPFLPTLSSIIRIEPKYKSCNLSFKLYQLRYKPVSHSHS